MDILGIGPLELLFIVLIALIVLGPKDMIKAGKSIGRTLRTIVSSDTWRVVNQASREVRNLPNRLIREAGIDDLQKQLPTQAEIRQQLGVDELNKSIQASTPAEFKPGVQATPSAQNAEEARTTPEADLSPWTTSPQTIAPPHLAEAAGDPIPQDSVKEDSESLPFTAPDETEQEDSSNEGGAQA